MLINALRKAHALLNTDASGLPVLQVAPPTPYQRRLVRLVSLAPDLQRDIFNGRQPPQLTLERPSRCCGRNRSGSWTGFADRSSPVPWKRIIACSGEQVTLLGRIKFPDLCFGIPFLQN